MNADTSIFICVHLRQAKFYIKNGFISLGSALEICPGKTHDLSDKIFKLARTYADWAYIGATTGGLPLRTLYIEAVRKS